MKFSIVLNTYQQFKPMYGLDVDIFTFLIEQLSKQTVKKEIELIIIDRLFDKRVDMFNRWTDFDIPVKYCPAKPSPWHEIDESVITISNDRNSGLFLANGKMILVMDDCVTFMHEKHLEQIWYYYQTGHYIRPLFHFFNYKVPGPYPNKVDALYDWLPGQIEIAKVELYRVGGNCARVHSLSTDIFENLNGFDERLDGAWGRIDTNWYYRVDGYGIIRCILREGQHPFKMVNHGHELRMRAFLQAKKQVNFEGFVCNEAYAQWGYKQVEEKKDHRANYRKLDDKDIEEIRSMCSVCPTPHLCRQKREPWGMEYYQKFQPVFNLARERKKYINEYGNTYGALNPWVV